MDKVNYLQEMIEARGDVAEWRFTHGTVKELEVGAEKGQIGGAYNAPNLRTGSGTSLYIRWDDGDVSTAEIEPYHFDDLGAKLDDVKLKKYTDADAPRIISPEEYSEVQSYSQDVSDLMASPGYIFELVQKTLDTLQPTGGNVEAGAAVVLRTNTLRSSTGMNESYQSSLSYVYGVAQGSFVGSEASAGVITEEKLALALDEVLRHCEYENNPLQVTPGEKDVIFLRGPFGGMMKHYLLHHIGGEALSEGLSTFGLNAVGSGERILSKSLDVNIVRPQALEAGATPWNGAGVAAGDQQLITEGKLMNPYLTTKWAQKLNMTHSPHGSMVATPHATLSDMIADMSDGLLILSAMGMHTQPKAKGDYSFPVRVAHVVKNGKVVGKTQATASGNFFEDLSRDDLLIGQDDVHEDSRVMQTRALIQEWK